MGATAPASVEPDAGALALASAAADGAAAADPAVLVAFSAGDRAVPYAEPGEGLAQA